MPNQYRWQQKVVIDTSVDNSNGNSSSNDAEEEKEQMAIVGLLGLLAVGSSDSIS